MTVLTNKHNYFSTVGQFIKNKIYKTIIEENSANDVDAKQNFVKEIKHLSKRGFKKQTIVITNCY